MSSSFDDDPFCQMQDAKNEAALNFQLRQLEATYFPGVIPIAGIEIGNAEGPAELDRITRIIRIDRVASRWSKVRRILILHELIHNALLVRDGDPDAEEGARFRAEIDRLWKTGAYDGLL